MVPADSKGNARKNNRARALSPVTDARRARVAALKVRGLSIRQMQAELVKEGGAGLNPATKRAWGIRVIWEDVQALTEQWRAAAKADTAEHKAEQLEQLRAVESEAWEAWARSKGTRKRTKTQRRTRPGAPLDDGGARAEKVSDVASVETLEMVGDPRFLAAIIEAEQRRAALLGLDAPKKITGDVTVKGVMLIPAEMPLDDWEKQAMEMQSRLKAQVRGDVEMPSA